VTDDELKQLFAETRQQIDSSATETRRYVHESIARSAVETRQYVDQSIERSSAELHRHLDIHAESVQTKFDLLAEGQAELNEKLERETSDIRDEVRRGFAETQAMIKFSHAELDRRLVTLEHGHRTLEDKVDKLEERIDRIESSTH
jgi:vacuolar-type H+-ATPase subunit D/Vma8